MSDATRIEWADATWNPMTGCTPVSEACEHCYAERMARRFNLRDLAPGERVSIDNYFAPRFHPDRLDAPLHWRKPRRVFVCSMSDLFHEAFTDEQINKVLNVVWLHAPQHIYMVLTKRPERMHDIILEHWSPKGLVYGRTLSPLPNLWLGVTVENQQRADERIPILLDTPAAVRFVSVEPMLGPVDLTSMGAFGIDTCHWCGREAVYGRELRREPYGAYGQCRGGCPGYFHQKTPGIDWVILGGETGPGARPMEPEWALDVYEQCKAAGVPFFFKRWGTGAPSPMSEMYDELEVTRDFPEVTR